jgi:hypothetical protein
LRNLILFLPLGASLTWLGRTTGQGVLFGALLAVAIELAQVAIPGRQSSLVDALLNTFGTWLGALVARSAHRFLRPEPRHAAWRALVFSVAAVVVLGITGVLHGPSYPRTRYFAGWTPELGHLATYDGHVVAASVGELAVPHGPIRRSSDVRTRLLEGRPIRVEATAGLPVSRLAPLFNIVDEQHREIVLLGPDRGDLVVRFRTRAAAMRLETPSVRLPDALRDLPPGARLVVTVQKDRGDSCIELNASLTCGLGFTVGSGWSFLFPTQGLARGLFGALNVLWVAALVLPVGYSSRREWWSLPPSLIVVLAVLLLPIATVSATTTPSEVGAAVFGLITGDALRVWVTRYRARNS